MLKEWNAILAAVIVFLMVAFYIFMLLHAASTSRLKIATRIAWCFFIIIAPLIGAFFYYAYQYDGKFSIKKYVAY
jgi:hypothetical protein